MATVDVKQQITELAALRRQIRMWQIGILVILVVLVAGSLITLRNSAAGLINEGAAHEQFVTDLSGRLQKSAVPSIEQMGTQALHEINWQDEVQKLNRRTPELAKASESEIKLLGAHLSTRGQKVLDSTFTAALKQREAKIKTMFPEATPQQLNDLLAALTQEASEQANDISTTLFAPHKHAMDGIVMDFTKIQTREAPNIKSETPTWEMALLIFDIARAELKDLEKPGPSKQVKAGAATKGKRL